MLRSVDDWAGESFALGEAQASAKVGPTSVAIEPGEGGPSVTIPDAHLLFNAQFSRAGADLILRGEGGDTYLVHDYFAGDVRAPLLSPEGAMLSANVVEALAGPVAPGQYAQAGVPAAAAAQAVGRVAQASSDATIVRNGVAMPAQAGDPILKGDVMQTVAGTLGVTFNDGSTLNLTANTRMVVNEFVYNPQGSQNSQLLDLVQGSLTFISGEIAHTGNMAISTPVATMGIRGTVGGVTTANDGTVNFYVSQSATGAVILDSRGVIIANVVQDGPMIIVRPAGPLQVIAEEIQKTPGQLAVELAALQQILSIKAIGDQILQQNQQADPNNNQTPNPQSTDKPLTTIQLFPEQKKQGQDGNPTDNTADPNYVIASAIIITPNPDGTPGTPIHVPLPPPPLPDVNDAPVLQQDRAAVSEEGLGGGLGDTVGSGDTSNSATASGQIRATDGDGDQLTFSLGEPSAVLTSNGVPIIWESNGNTLTGSAGGNTIVTIVINQHTGAYTVTLSGPVDHPNGGAEDVVSIDVPVSVSDGQQTSTTTLTVKVEDDAPKAANYVVATNATTVQGFNAAFVLDYSGSISNGELAAMLAAVKAAAQAIFEGTTGDVKITVVAFGVDAATLGPFTDYTSFAGAIDATHSSRPVNSGGTNFNAALQELMDKFAAVEGAKNEVFFLSDGQSTLNSNTAAEWNEFVDENGLNVTVVGIGDGIDAANLQAVDVDGSGALILVAQFSDLVESLLDIVGESVTGNVITGGAAGTGFGADGGRILSVTVDGKTYTWDGDGTITENDGETSCTQTGTSISVTTALGGTFTFYFAAGNGHAAGEWSYAPPDSLSGPTDEVFHYVLIDNDGDQSGANITVAVTAETYVTPPATASLTYSGTEDHFSYISLDVEEGSPTARGFVIDSLPDPDAGYLWVYTGLGGGFVTAQAGVEYSTEAVFRFVPAYDWNGTSQFTYHAVGIDGLVDATPATITLEWTGDDDPPVATPIVLEVTEDDGPVTIDLLSGASDPDAGETLQIVMSTVVLSSTDGDGNVLTQPVSFTTSGNKIIVNPGQFNYLGAGEKVILKATYEVADSSDARVSTSAELTVNGADEPPVANSDTISLMEDTASSGLRSLLLANDSEANGGTLTITAATAAVGGSVNLNGGDPIFTPAANFSGQASFTYTVSNGDTGTSTATAYIDVAPVADAPTISSGSPSATPVPAGGEFRVNSDTSGSGKGTSAVTGLSGGGFVVTWLSNTQDGSKNGVYGQRFGAEGVAVGNEFRINTYTLDDQTYPSVTSLDDGGFVVTWVSNNQDGSSNGVYGQRFGADGNAAGSEFRVNTHVADNQMHPTVVGLGDGGFVITWNSIHQDGSGWGIFGQRYDAAGAVVGNEFRINTYTAGDQMASSVTGLGEGGFVVTWMSYNLDAGGYGIYGQRFGSEGTAVGNEFRINTAAFDSFQPSVADLGNGGFVVTWMSYSQDGSGPGIFGQRFNADGIATGNEFRINTFTYDEQNSPSVTGLADGGFVVTWMSYYQDGDRSGIFGQRFDANGAAVGDEFRLNQSTMFDQYFDGNLGGTGVAVLANGQIVQTWNGFGLNQVQSYGIYARLFDIPSVAHAEDTPISLPFTVNFGSDNDGSETHTLALSGLPTGFTVTDGENQTVSNGSNIDVTDWDLSALVVTPSTNWNGSFSATLTASVTDTATLSNGVSTATTSASKSVTVTVAATNDAPVATPIVLEVTEDDGPVTIDLLSGASDPDAGATLQIVMSTVVLSSTDGDGNLLTQPVSFTTSGNQITVDPGQFFYLGAGEKAVLKATYDVVDSSGARVSTSATLTVNGADEAPATNDIYGSQVVSAANNGGYVTVALNSVALSALNAKGQFAVGGEISTFDADPITAEYIFGWSTGAPASATQLILQVDTGGILSTVALNATHRGWYDANGNHNALNNGYGAGGDIQGTLRDYFVFNLSGVSGTVQSASLSLYNANVPYSGFQSLDASETYVVHAVSTPIASLIASHSGRTDIFADLGSPATPPSNPYGVELAEMSLLADPDAAGASVASVSADPDAPPEGDTFEFLQIDRPVDGSYIKVASETVVLEGFNTVVSYDQLFADPAAYGVEVAAVLPDHLQQHPDQVHAGLFA